MENWLVSELGAMCRAPLFVSQDPEVVKRQTAGAFKEHQLVWRTGAVDSALYRADVGELSFFVLHYGAAVHIEPGPLEGFVLFQVPLSGSARICVNGRAVAASPRTAAVISPSLNLELDWHEGCRQLLLKIPRARVERTCRSLISSEHGGDSGADLGRPLEFEPEMPLDNDAGRSWQHQLASQLCHLASPSAGALPASLLRVQEEALIHHLLLRQRSNYTPLLARPASPAAPRSLRMARSYIEAHLLEALTLESIAQASATSVRGLCLAFRRHLHCSPMAYVRSLRLERAHTELTKAAPGTQVTDVALRWGFNHVGRFSMAYRQRYGRTPLQTLREG